VLLGVDVEPDPKLEDLFFWATVAAENGSVGAQAILASWYTNSKDARLRRRARFWLRRSAEGGNPHAAWELENVAAYAPDPTTPGTPTPAMPTPTPDENRPIRAGDWHLIPEAEFATAERQALDGSVEAARRLYYHYEIGEPDGYAGPDSLFWITVAAQNGGIVPRYLLGRTLSAAADARRKRRARFWLRQAADAGYGPAKEALGLLDRATAASPSPTAAASPMGP
jgi:TPR repeat protein